jgi:hydroxyacylglutathione hydrolase
MPAWIEAGEDFTRTQQLSTAEVMNRASNRVVVDVRSEKERAAGHIEGAQHIVLGDVPTHMDGLPWDRPLITVCGSGYRSSIAVSLLTTAGFATVSSMDGGMTAWDRQKLPTTRE